MTENLVLRVCLGQGRQSRQLAGRKSFPGTAASTGAGSITGPTAPLAPPSPKSFPIL